MCNGGKDLCVIGKRSGEISEVFGIFRVPWSRGISELKGYKYVCVDVR